MIDYLNLWLDEALKKAKRVYEDSDRKALADKLFNQTIRRVNSLTIKSAIRTPEPSKIERTQTTGSSILTMEWRHVKSGWHLRFSVHRAGGEKPYVSLEFQGAEDTSYSTDSPTDANIQKALHDYFEAWKKDP